MPPQSVTACFVAEPVSGGEHCRAGFEFALALAQAPRAVFAEREQCETGGMVAFEFQTAGGQPRGLSVRVHARGVLGRPQMILRGFGFGARGVVVTRDERGKVGGSGSVRRRRACVRATRRWTARRVSAGVTS
jgi:hypothetical protein